MDNTHTNPPNPTSTTLPFRPANKNQTSTTNTTTTATDTHENMPYSDDVSMDYPLDQQTDPMDVSPVRSTPSSDGRPSSEGRDRIRADDYEYIAKNLLPPEDPELETIEQTHHTWHIKDWTKLQRREHGPAFTCGGAEWRILFFPFGNNAEFASFYLDAGSDDSSKLPDDWYRCVQFGLVLWNPNDPTLFHSHYANHRFTPDEADWGFTRFCELRRLFNTPWDPARSDRWLVEDDCVNVTAYVRVIKDPTGVLWHNFHNYNSKKETGMVGLKNQGATCYLNSLLQSLYLTNKFRKAVYQIPTEKDANKKNSAYTLQRLFYSLQTSEHPVSTTELTASFGWESRQIFEQQDVQELSRKLMERLEDKMKGTSVEKALEELFVGKSKTYISCINVNYTSSRIEDFWDIQLNVSGNKTLHDSFMDYIQVETLEGDNKYDAGEPYKLQDAKKGVIFETFPDILHLQLKRFEYDFTRDMMMKINDRHEFPEEFDASAYLSADADRSEPWIYKLYGVLVHSGDLQAGHYYAFIRPTKDGPFYKFDDDRVTRATLRETMDENFGGEYPPPRTNSLHPLDPAQQARQQHWAARGGAPKRTNNAYMLVYLRKSRVDDVMQPVTEADVPPHIARAIVEERADAARRRKEREEQHLYLQLQLVSEESFRHHHGFDLTALDLPASDPAAPESLRVLRAKRVGELAGEVAGARGLRPQQVRFWSMVNRQNKTVRPDTVIADSEMTVEEAYVKLGSNKQGPFRLYVDVAPLGADGKVEWPDGGALTAPGENGGGGVVGSAGVNGGNGPNTPILIFLKYFDLPKQELTGVCQVFVKRHSKVSELGHVIHEKMGWSSSVDFLLFEEIKHTMIEPMKPKQTFHQSEIQDGDIICFQRKYSDSEMPDVPFPGTKEFYDFLYFKRTIQFIPYKNHTTAAADALETTNGNANGAGCPVTPATDKEPEKATPDETFTLTLYGKLTYEQWTAKVGEHLHVDPTHLRFAPVTQHTGRPKPFIKRTLPIPLHQLMAPTSQFGYATPHRPDALFYEVLEESLSEFESKKVVKLGWFPEGLNKEVNVELLVPKQGNVADVIEHLRAKVGAPREKWPNIRLFEVHNNRIYKEVPESYGVTGLNEYVGLYAEPVPVEETEMGEEEYLVNAFHYDKEPNRPHGIPFKLVVKPGELFKATKERVAKRINVRGKSLEKITFTILSRPYNQYPPRRLEDDDVLSDYITVDNERVLGLEHPNKTRYFWDRSASFSIR